MTLLGEVDRNADLAWLAGIIDGEGTISAQVVTLRDKRIRITPFVSITNTDGGILMECIRILDSLGIKNRTFAKPLVGPGFKGNLNCANIRIDGHKPVRILLPAILPYLHSVKREFAEKVLQFVASRRIGLYNQDVKGRIGRREYSRAEIELISSVRTHPKAKSLDAMCAAPNVGETLQ